MTAETNRLRQVMQYHVYVNFLNATFIYQNSYIYIVTVSEHYYLLINED